jgi:ferrochelatase
LPIYWGNRNWRPLLTDTVAQMTRDGVQRALAFVTSAQSSYSGCRQYRENIESARLAAGPGAPVIDKVRVFYNHPDYIAATVDQIRSALAELPAEHRAAAQLVCTAHSIPVSMAAGCPYEQQLQEIVRLVREDLAWPADRAHLVYQSRSGRPEDPWLEPDVCDQLRLLAAQGARAVVVAPIGFLSDHMEVLYDLDEEAAAVCRELALPMARAGTVGVHPRFVQMVVQLIRERLDPQRPREALGQYGPNWDVCPVDCCPAPRRPGAGAPVGGPPTARGECPAS